MATETYIQCLSLRKGNWHLLSTDRTSKRRRGYKEKLSWMSILIQLTQLFHLSKVWDVARREINAQVLIQTLEIFVILQEEITLKLVQMSQSSSLRNNKKDNLGENQQCHKPFCQRTSLCGTKIQYCPMKCED